ncbi:MAG: hypothetical protein G01um101425_958 [Candidatus Peregrinibacteria bacterium Gr01-1014_25]|nr:MAG: hypothetical protein G01um101425_958 [Candidatus Peregrinibacteria bacterium Gr01-1014_25]
MTIPSWLAIAVAVAVAASANSVAALWAGDKLSPIYLPLLLILSPLVFVTFGIVTTSKGLSIASGVIDSLLVLTTMFIGLVLFGEWKYITNLQLMGMGMAVIGIVLMLTRH